VSKSLIGIYNWGLTIKIVDYFDYDILVEETKMLTTLRATYKRLFGYRLTSPSFDGDIWPLAVSCL